MRFETVPGEQLQVDWIVFRRRQNRLLAFVCGNTRLQPGELRVMICFNQTGHFNKIKNRVYSDEFKQAVQPTREHVKNDVAACMRYYNLQWLHTTIGDVSSIEYENSSRKVSA